MNDNTLGGRIAELRRSAGMTQEQLATQLGLTYQAVSKWENNQSCPDVMLLPQLADTFRVSIDALFGREMALAPVASAIPTEEEEEIQCSSRLPWPDDETLYAVLFKGHTPLTDEPLAYTGERERIHFVYSGPALNVLSHFNVTCENCEIHGDISASGSVNVGDGSIGGSVSAGGSVNCTEVAGDISADGDVNCAEVGGNLDAGGDVNCGDVSGSVRAGGDVNCGDVDGSANAGCDVSCGDVDGSVTAGCDVSCGDVRGNVTAGCEVDCGDIGGRSISGFSRSQNKSGRKPHVSVHVVNDDPKGTRELNKDFDLELSHLGDDLRDMAKDIRELFKKR